MPKGNKTIAVGGGSITSVCCCGYRAICSNSKTKASTAMKLHKKFCKPPAIEEQALRQAEAVADIATKAKGDGGMFFDSLHNTTPTSTQGKDLGLLKALTTIAMDINDRTI